MLRAVIFDFDGVIADTETMHFEAFNRALQPYHVQISKEQYFSEYLGFTDRDLICALVEEEILKIEERQIDSVAQRKKELFDELIKMHVEIIGGVREFLQMLEENGVVMAICSGALLDEIELILERGNLRQYFKVIVAAEHVAKGKPAPDGFLLAMKRLNEKCSEPIKANQCVVIEDSRWGLEGADAAGMHTVAVTNSYGADELSLAEIVTDNLSELTINDLNRLCG